ncbi:ATP-dependent helicase [Streptomyces sp. NBC_00257]|uniref:ATP-dependent helicase n=1 Tax=unclassified Streptomyces TaxID=2593676 RepID=UPI0022562BF5|nr:MULTISPECIES: ATP-dependent DNA helicase [unclassified Streptomyces]WTB56631.1 ATP-dependent helicase [Streptomyces sp. NBC_00826]WTH90486.1 ATP-dependent helicase [Streptomyces sp. NBC_00825]WTH99213.1 ATP-dependent helicase [Streptomyces sp. NBC_00822]MCX4864640.1 ATP-dependent helicase [Streptomyces sp. NBC_00906]MCX4895878.1 ATP-dependent helicase [Streptomyces sp. NBC_00892]
MSSSSFTRHSPHRQTRQRAAGAYRLVRTPPGSVDPPLLDAAQRAVVDHPGGPLLVLAGPGTGKTTTLVEAVAARIARGGDPARVLVLTFSRKAAVELRDRMAARLGAARGPQATTFHSFCYALVRAHQDADLFAEPMRLLSGPEQDVTVRDLLAGQLELERDGFAHIRWPDELRACLTTRGFADEVRAVLARSRELGLGPEALAAFARRTGRPDWGAAAEFLAEYLDVLDAQGVLDYAELVHRAVLLAERPEVSALLAGQYDAVFVDEYQDTDPAQVRLLHALAGNRGSAPGAGGGRDLIAFGDPDQSIYAFRGADVNGILDFPETFRRADGAPAPVGVLTTSRRSGGQLLAATRLLTRRMPLTRLPAAKARAHRELAAVREGGSVEAYTYPTASTELENIADLLRRAHLEDGVPWNEMAVLVRAGGRTLPSLRRALTSAGVPLEVDGDDLPLRHEPAVAPLLTALRTVATAALRRGAPGAEEGLGAEGAESAEAEAPEGAEGAEGAAGPEHAPGAEDPAEPAGADVAQGPEASSWLDTETALALLASPLGSMDAADLRRLGRALRDEERAAGKRVPAPSGDLLARALAEPERLVTHDPAYARGAQRLGALLRKARELLEGGGTAEEALWALWSGTPWPGRLERAALRGGAGGRNADRDLDAVCALFDTAARAEERTGGRGALNFLEEVDAQDIAADTLSRRAVRPDVVRLMTAHRSKGLEWRLVVVAGVQEGLWPDLRRRGSLLEADRIGRDGLAEPLTPGALLAEERRLFYVAATRARERLVVTAVKAPADDGDQPSRFLTELGAEPRDVTGRPRRPLAVAALVAELRATTVDPEASDALREEAARRLARLAALTDDEGQPLVPAAHPYRWWGLYEPTRSSVPLRDRDQPVALSGSALDQLANTCALQWFLGREVKADAPATAAQGFGNVVHVLADEVASGRTPADLAVLMERLDSVWDGLVFDAPWKSRQEKEQARAALERFLRWHVMDRTARTPAASEHDFDVTLGAGEYQVRIRGSMDRVEQDTEGRAYVVDFKTGKQSPTKDEVARHPQLAVYQLAVREGAVDDVFDGRRPEPGGAELVQLRQPAPKKEGGDALPKVQAQEPLAGEWVSDLLATAAGRVLDERFTPTTGQHCTHCAFRASCSAQPEGRHVLE